MSPSQIVQAEATAAFDAFSYAVAGVGGAIETVFTSGALGVLASLAVAAAAAWAAGQVPARGRAHHAPHPAR